MKNIRSIHSTFKIHNEESYYVLAYYERPETVLVLHWVQCCKELSEKSSFEEIQGRVYSDSIFSLLSDTSKDFLSKLLVEYICSFESDNDLSAALFLIKELNSLLMIKIRNELIAISKNTFGHASATVTSLDEDVMVSVRNITIYDTTVDSKAKTADMREISTSTDLQYLTLPGASKGIPNYVVRQCINNCYSSNVTDVQDIYNFITIFAFLNNCNENELRTAVISYLVKIAIRVSTKLNKAQLFKDKFRILMQEGA
jgi:hypothetical protein